MPRFVPSRRVLAAIAAPALVGGALAACASPQSVPGVAFPSNTAPQILSVPTAAVASYTGYAPPLNAIVSTITGYPAGTQITYPMTPVTFTVTVRNTSSYQFVQLEPLIVMGQCACNPQDYDLSPHVAVQYRTSLLSPTTGSTKTPAANSTAPVKLPGTWQQVAVGEANAEGTFAFNKQVGTIDLGPHASMSFTFSIAGGKTQSEPGLTSGTGSLNFYLLQLPQHTRVITGDAADATIPIDFKFP